VREIESESFIVREGCIHVLLLDMQAIETFCWCHLSTNEGHSPPQTHTHTDT